MKPLLFTSKIPFGVKICGLLLLAIFLNKTSIAQSAKAKPNITYQIITNTDNTWGYDIYIDGKLRIHQPSIPALPGNGGFVTKRRCKLAIKLVTDKIKMGKMPPTVTVAELKNAGAI